MNKTLKGKITNIYMLLISIIAIIAIASIFSLYRISYSMNNLLTDNYKSIDAVNDMIQNLEDQNAATFDYIRIEKQSGINNFFKKRDEFYKSFNIESNNTTESGEKALTEKVSNDYLRYLKLFSEVQEIRNTKGIDASYKYYNDNITPLYNTLKSNLEAIKTKNTNAILGQKNRLKNSVYRYMYVLIIFSLTAILGGLIISRKLLDKFLRPVYSLTETIKSIKQGELYKEVSVISNDEIGNLAIEFNKMTSRLREFENSTKGKLLIEKNKSIAIVKSLAEPLVVLNTNFNILLVNDAFKRFFKLDEKIVLNKSFNEVMENEELFSHVVNVINTRSKENSKIIHFTTNNYDYYFNVIISLIRGDTPDINSIVIVFQNVTQLKHIEKLKAEFMSTISHEFKTPLTSIMMGASLLDDSDVGELNTEQKKIVSTIKEDGEKLSVLVTNLLQLSRIEWNKSLFNIKPCSIIGIMEQCVRGFYEQASAKDINIYIDAEENLPKISADAEKMVWVINNLLSNALKYTNAGDQIIVSATADHDYMYVSVKDTGVGIPEEYVEKIFEKFTQVKGYDNEIRGTGLGLTIAKEIVETHKGKIWCESQLDLGSKFTFSIPLAK